MDKQHQDARVTGAVSFGRSLAEMGAEAKVCGG